MTNASVSTAIKTQQFIAFIAFDFINHRDCSWFVVLCMMSDGMEVEWSRATKVNEGAEASQHRQRRHQKQGSSSH